MILVRGIKGDIKLNPAIKLWGGIALLSIGTAWAVYGQFVEYREDMVACEAQGGIWINGAPVRIGVARTLGGHCEPRELPERW